MWHMLRDIARPSTTRYLSTKSRIQLSLYMTCIVVYDGLGLYQRGMRGFRNTDDQDWRFEAHLKGTEWRQA